MQFNEVEYRVKLETMLYNHSLNKGLTKQGLDTYCEEVRHYTETLFGPFSISLLPFIQKPENICKLTIYVSPMNDKFNFQYDYHFEIALNSG